MKLSARLTSDWPFAAARAPFFYGWVVFALSTLGYLCSVPGQTMGMAVFADTFITELQLTRTQLSLAYLLGTVCSALLLPGAGRWYDRYGARLLMVAASLLLAAALLFISGTDALGAALAQALHIPLPWVTFPLIMIGYFGVRFAGQGVLTSASRNVLLVWFERRRGFVVGCSGVFVSLGFSLAPLLLATLITMQGWRGALWTMAFGVGGLFALVALLTVRDHPRVSGLLADGEAGLTGAAGQQDAGSDDRSAADAKRDPVFWLYAGALSMHALFGTAVTFHVVAIFAAAGRDQSEAFGMFLPQALVSVVVNLTASMAADRMRLQPLLVLMLVFFLVASFAFTRLETPYGYALLVLGFGVGGGLWGVLSNLVFIRQYGARHLGEVSGFNAAITVFASAIGPLVFSLANDRFGTFEAAAVACGVGLSVLLAAALWLPQPHDRSPRRRGN